MYRLSTPLANLKGVGAALEQKFRQEGLHTVADLLLHVPLRYEDRSARTHVADLKVGELVTLSGQILQPKNYYKGRRSIQSATLVDETGRVKLMWFNHPHIITRFHPGETFLVSGKFSDRGYLVQPTVESVRPGKDSIHTGRLVPIYSQIDDIPLGTIRKLLKEATDQLVVESQVVDQLLDERESGYTLGRSLQQLHFPDTAAAITTARRRLALEELVQLIRRSQQIKQQWYRQQTATVFPPLTAAQLPALPFRLTQAQQRCIAEVTADLQQSVPMNRLLLGDVGSGKTAVAGWAAHQVLAAGRHVALVAPTQILAEQHAQTLHRIFPQLTVVLVTAQTKTSTNPQPSQATLFVGTHALLHILPQVQPGLLIYDEQHRFGVRQRSVAADLTEQPHLLTLTATPIPRTLLLTIFSHLSVSILDELPPGRLPVKSWLVPSAKREDAYRWISAQLAQQPAQALVICPFIDPSQERALENVAAATQLFDQLQRYFAAAAPSLRLSLLHGRMKKAEQQQISAALYRQEVDVLVTTPIVEVGVDLPAASIIVIEAAERFGLASLHQLRGRVGRAGQQAYCLLFTSTESEASQQRLTAFCQTTNGLELAELDLQRRGAGDIFGTQQHGLDQLHFANWADLELVTTAKRLADQLIKQDEQWQSVLADRLFQDQEEENTPLAN